MSTPRPDLLCKTFAPGSVAPNWTDYAGERARFTWQAARAALAGLPGGGLNIGYEAVDRHVADGHGDRTAFIFLSEAGRQQMDFATLASETSRFANVLRQLGVGRGETVFVLAPRCPALYVAVLGALKNGNVACPLFAAFGPEPLATRMRIGDARVLVTTPALYRRKVASLRDGLPGLRYVLLIREGDAASAELPADTRDLGALMTQADDHCAIAPTNEEDIALLHFTSGTTGTPKGALHVHGAAVTHWATGRYALDLHARDIFWCTADPGWVTGTSYGIIAPLLHGVTSVVDAAEFDAQRWYQILQDEAVTVWYTAPTALRMLMKTGADLAKQFRFPALRFIASVGEPLNPEVVWWGQEVLGLPVHDNWWQTETGGIMIANTPAFPIKPGSMGRPLPGVEAAIVRREEAPATAGLAGSASPTSSVRVITETGEEGELALRRGWPSMLRGYLHQPERYRQCFAGDWYLSGDLARCDADGYYWFVGRGDDVIKSAGHLIGPFEVESVLMEHPAVAEAGVIGKPDPTVGETVKAFVSLKTGIAADEDLRRTLLAHARQRLGAAVAPKEIDFLAVLPRTRSGKIMRRLLKARELGLPEGDTSTLEAGG